MAYYSSSTNLIIDSDELPTISYHQNPEIPVDTVHLIYESNDQKQRVSISLDRADFLAYLGALSARFEDENTCQQCSTFLPSPKATYCSDACRQQAYRVRMGTKS
jgi:hypothetical protein